MLTGLVVSVAWLRVSVARFNGYGTITVTVIVTVSVLLVAVVVTPVRLLRIQFK